MEKYWKDICTSKISNGSDSAKGSATFNDKWDTSLSFWKWVSQYSDHAADLSHMNITNPLEGDCVLNDMQKDSDVSKDEQDKIVIEQFKDAVTNDDETAVGRLLRNHSSLVERINESWFAFDSPAIVLAASSGNREMVDVLLQNDADINAKSTWWAGGFGVLHHDHRDLARYLIERGAHVDPHAAAGLGMLERLPDHASGSTAVVEILVKNGVPI